jgi:type VI secretion system protein ImpF
MTRMAPATGAPADDKPGALAGPVADRLWPVLLDRLTDFEPQRQKESMQARTMSRKAYREGVLRDLQWLLNASNLDASIDFNGSPEAQRSVVNFGIATLSGHFTSNIDIVQLEAAVRDAILRFEPRLLPHTVEVKVVTTEHSLDLHNVLGMEIRGELWSIPYPLEILLRSDIDLETGHVALHDQSRGD